MLKKLMPAAVLGLAVTTPFAQSILGATAEVQGLVTVSTASGMNTAVTGSPVVDGSRWVTSSGSFATLRLTSGCILRMRPNQSITVAADKSCDELLALLEVTRDGTALAGVASPGAAAGVGGAIAALGAGVVVTLVSDAARNRPSTPGGGNGGGGGGNVGGGGGGNIPISAQ